ncbi:MAG: hypothetical protein ACP5RC_09255 [Halothiobacillaceae bacterium]
MNDLRIDLIPRTAWFSNLRSELPRREWDLARRKAYSLANDRCEACGGRGRKWPVEAHKQWNFDESTGVQTLTRILALCPDCHAATHYGLAEIRGQAAAARRHLMRVNRWTEFQVDSHIHQAFVDWHRRSLRPWTLDVRWLFDFIGCSEELRRSLRRGTES